MPQPSSARAGTISRLANYVCTAREKPFAPELQHQALRCILDLTAATLTGLDERAHVAVRHTASSLMGEGDTPMWFAGQMGNPVAAAWVNSMAASVLDLDDGHALARGHPGAVIIPTVFAEIGHSSEEMLRAIVIGYQICVSVAQAQVIKGYVNSGVWGAISVVAAIAVLRKTPQHILEMAMGIAAESGPNQRLSSAGIDEKPAVEGSDVKEGIPWSVVTGFAALAQAMAGMTGPRNVLDASWYDDIPTPETSEAILYNYFKLYSCCRHCHPPLDAFRSLIDGHGIQAADISSVVVDTYNGALRISNRCDPANLVQLQYSIPYCLGLVALRGPQALLPVRETALGQADVIAFAKLVQLNIVEEFDVRSVKETVARVTIKTRQGQTYVSAPTLPSGDASTPLTWEELEEKYHSAMASLYLIDTLESEVREKLDAVPSFLRKGDLNSLMKTFATVKLTRD